MAKIRKLPGKSFPTSKNPKVDAYLAEPEPWRAEIKALRQIALGFPLSEEFKWKKPCYAFNGHNVVILIPFKETVALMFCKGSLLKDAKGLLEKPGENTQVNRWIKFTSIAEIAQLEPVLKAYIQEAIAIEQAGLKPVYQKPGELVLVAELQHRLDQQPALKAAFAALTPGRQRAYNYFISGAKQPETRQRRIDQHQQRILDGKGMQDDYL